MDNRDFNSFDTLKHIIDRLRGPDGCPWDKKQTHASLRANLLDECYEVLEALDSSQPEKLCEELGDLLMQIVLHARIASESGEFALADVIHSINTKLVHRHPHIFGSFKVSDADQVAANWEALKQEERKEGDSLLGSVPRSMPALAYSQEIQHRVARVGFDWKDDQGVIDKLAEEAGELARAETKEHKEAEFGDLLFVLTNIARRMDIDLEAALRQANQRFYRRFSCMEERCRERGVAIGSLSFEEQNALWEQAKEQLQDRHS